MDGSGTANTQVSPPRAGMDPVTPSAAARRPASTSRARGEPPIADRRHDRKARKRTHAAQNHGPRRLQRRHDRGDQRGGPPRGQAGGRHRASGDLARRAPRNAGQPARRVQRGAGRSDRRQPRQRGGGGPGGGHRNGSARGRGQPDRRSLRAAGTDRAGRNGIHRTLHVAPRARSSGSTRSRR